jgi:fatty-acyl-CoA synthase
VLNLLKNAPDEMKAGINHPVKVMTAGAAPPAAVIEGMERMNFEVTHLRPDRNLRAGGGVRLAR